MGLKKRIGWLLLLFMLLSIIVAGCSNSKTVSADVNQKLELAVKYLSEQKFEKAILAYQEVIKIDSKNVTAYKGLSLTFILQEKPGEAEKALQAGLKVLSNNKQLQLAMAGLMVDQGKNDQAESIYKELLKDNPSVSAYQAYTYYLNQAGKQAEAIALLEQGAANNAQAYQLNSMLAELYIKSGDQSKALAAINKSLTAEPNQSAAYKQLAKLYKDKWPELIALGEQYIQQNQAKTGVLYKLSGLFGMQQYEELIKEYEKLGTEVKDSLRVKLLVAQAYVQLGQQDKVGALIETIKTMDIKDAGMLADLANYYLESGDKDNALKFALRGIISQVYEVDNYYVLYRIYAKEDKAKAEIWRIKYLLNSVIGIKEAINEFQKADNKEQNTEKDQIYTNNGKVQPATTSSNQDGDPESCDKLIVPTPITSTNNSPNITSNSVTRESGLELVKALPEIQQYFTRTAYAQCGNWGDHKNKDGKLYYLYRAYESFDDPERPFTPTFDRYYVDSTTGWIYKELHGNPEMRYQKWSGDNWIPSNEPK